MFPVILWTEMFNAVSWGFVCHPNIARIFGPVRVAHQRKHLALCLLLINDTENIDAIEHITGEALDADEIELWF